MRMFRRVKVMSASSFALSMEIGLRMIGIWPGMSYTWLYRFAWILTAGIALTFQYWYIIVHVETDDLSHLMDGLSVTLEHSVMVVKFIFLWLNSRYNKICYLLQGIVWQIVFIANCNSIKISFINTRWITCRRVWKYWLHSGIYFHLSAILYDVLATIATDWREVAVSKMHIMTNNANLSRYFSNLIIGLHLTAGFFYGVGVFMANGSDYDEDGKPIREFTLKMQLPFECKESPSFELVACLAFLHQLACCIVCGTMNSLLVLLILHASGQIDILCDSLKEISPESNSRRYLTVSIARKLINRHYKIITFSKEIEQLFCYIALAQFLSSTLVICCLGFMIMMSIGGAQDSGIDNSALMKAIVFYMAATVEAFTYCFSGEYLSAKSKAIGDAAYKSLWYNLRPSESNIILLIMIRSQKRLTITAGKITDLSLEVFTSIVKASVSYISVLHAMN